MKPKKKEVIGMSASIPIHEVEQRSTMKVPNLGIADIPEQPANVNYSVPKVRMSKLAKALGSINMTYRDVGLKSFDYAYDDWSEKSDAIFR